MSSTREDIEADLMNEYPDEALRWRDGLEAAQADNADLEQKRAAASSSQSGTDRKLTEVRKREAELLSEIERLKSGVQAGGFEVEEVITDNGEAKLTEEELAADLPSEVVTGILAERTARARGRRLASATSSQGGTDRKLTEALAEVARLKAEVERITRERDAARLAYVELIEKHSAGK